jgi:hypothetical protein
MEHAEIMTEWTRRLESGDYLQGRGKLQEGDRYCCLGVLCEIAVEQGVIRRPAMVGGVVTYDNYSTAHLPYSVAYWSGITPEGRLSSKVGGWEDLTQLNDNGYTFKQIAEVIRTDALLKP